MKSQEQIARDRDFDWNAFLRSWDERVKLGVGRMLMQHGLGGPPETGTSEYIKGQTRDGSILELLQPVAGSLASPEGVHELIREGQDRLRELSARADLHYVVFY